ncbi:unnamed protein product [Danaus chrysippus]|uniref:(African queen) hypothetical protein n=2 Tax=Danaus chrysippus TaxID=151541 RepID=A0A8J2WA81_9NEOP|nr:unnamed protein product [Danaus chrysippus]
MPETIIESVLSGKLQRDILFKWLNDELVETTPDDCILLCSNRNEFVSYFLTFLRDQTESILQTNTNSLPTPFQGTPEKNRKHHRSISDPTCDNDKSNESTQKSERKTEESPNRDKKRNRRVKTKLFSDDRSKDALNSSDELRISTGIDRLMLSSTPMKNGLRDSPNSPASPVTPQSRSFREYERCDTPRTSRHSRSQDKNVSLADYLVNIQPKSAKKKRSKNTSNDDSDPKLDLDISNSEMFPEIGARKSSSLKSERRRIKPTNIDKSKKSFSLNSFNAENFQQPSPLALEENLAFKPKLQPKESSNSFDAERNILKQERQKLMEKFNVLNTTSTPITPSQIKILRKEEPSAIYTEADIAKLTFKEKIDIIVDIYDILFKNNLIVCINTEIYFLITILLSKQCEDDIRTSERLLETDLANNILKPIHNSTYFAVKSLWNQRIILEVILDKNSLKILGENKKVRSFSPDLAKFLLNSYGLKCEAETQDKSKNVSQNRCSNGIICYNHETDNAENFPSILSFQNFKKQRDMFYEILRWYQDTQSTGVSRSTMRARTRALISTGPSAANHAHLATLITHMLIDTVPDNEQESKLSKLQRRLTCSSSSDSNALPRFTDREMFYKEFIMYADSESFRVHLYHALAAEIISLDSVAVGGDASNGSDVSKEFLQLSKKLGLLAKFLGYITSLPYAQVPIDILLKTGAFNLKNQKEEIFTAPDEKVLENSIALRNYSQPPMDIKGLLLNANQNGRLTITIPWIVHYLSMLDYTTLRLKYYQNILKLLYNIHQKLNITSFKKNTVIFLKLNLGWLFDLPHVPQEVFYTKSDPNIGVISVIDCEFDIEENVLQELCPYLKDLSIYLSTSRLNQDSNQFGSFRHITPVSLSLNNEDRIKNKEKELQMRLEEELIKSQPSSTRRVLELVTERVTSAAVKELTTNTLVDARKKARTGAAAIVAGCRDRSGLLATLHSHYSSHLSSLRANALSSSRAMIKARVTSALAALLPMAPPPLRAVVGGACCQRVDKWLTQHWTSTDILCKDIKAEMETLCSVGPGVSTAGEVVDLVTCNLDEMMSPAQAILDLKEQICVTLEGGVPCLQVLRSCKLACDSSNVFCRAPTLITILHLSVDFCVVYVSRHGSKVLNILPEFKALWEQCCPHRKRVEREEDETRERSQDITKYEDCYFDRILCPRNIMLLSETKSSDVWPAMAEILVYLLKHNFLTEDSLTEQCLAVYKQDWPQNILENLSTCMRTVSSKWSSTGKFTLFLDFLADFCNDMDYDLIE